MNHKKKMTINKAGCRIGFIHHGEIPGGAPTSLKNLILELSEFKEFDLEIYCSYKKMISFFTKYGLKTIKYPRICKLSGKVFIGLAHLSNIKTFLLFFLELFLSPLIIWQEIIFLRKNNPDIVHLNSSVLWSSAVAAFFLKKPIIWHIRENFSRSKYNPVRFFYSRFIQVVSAHIICISPSELKSARFKDANKLSVIYNGAIIKDFINELSEQKKEQTALINKNDINDYIILTLGGGSFQKGTFQILQSLKALDVIYKLIIAGDPFRVSRGKGNKLISFLHSIENLFVRVGLRKCFSWYYKDRLSNSLLELGEDRVELTGVVDNVQNLIGRCDVLIFGGTTPHFGRPIYEAWLMKKPVIAFRNHVTEAEIENGVDGLLVDPLSPKDLAETIMYLRENPEIAFQMGHKGYIKAIERFDQKKNALKVKEIYEAILS